MRTFIIGDIHGCYKELNQLYTYLVEKVGFLPKEDKIIFLGDYVDRGPDCKSVIDLCLQIKKTCAHTVFLKGNHEDMLLAFLDLGGQYGDAYMMNGGGKFFASYKGPDGKLPLDYDIKSGMSKYNILQALPKEHLDFLLNLELIHIQDKYIAVHAGIDPDMTLAQQTPNVLLWIRDYFYSQIVVKPIGKLIIHGHTPVEKVCFDLPHRIMLDTGCVFDGRLSCLELNEDDPIQSKIYFIEKNGNSVKMSF